MFPQPMKKGIFGQVISLDSHTPTLAEHVFVAPGAFVIGKATIGRESSIWFNTVIRADGESIVIGEKTNIQDNSTVHITEPNGRTNIGSSVTIGHNAIIHACTIEDICLIGMGSIILDGATIPKHSFVAAGSLISPGKKFQSGYLIKGSPAIEARKLSDLEIEAIEKSSDNYIRFAKQWMK